MSISALLGLFSVYNYSENCDFRNSYMNSKRSQRGPCRSLSPITLIILFHVKYNNKCQNSENKSDMKCQLIHF